MKQVVRKNLKRYLIAYAFLMFSLVGFSQKMVSLDGEWKFRKANSNDEWLLAKVPGTVHTDLFSNGEIADPYLGCNNIQLGWIDSLDWEYKRAFYLPKSFKLSSPIDLVFDGLDTYAQVYVNDSLVLVADNMFRQWRKDCSSVLRHGQNKIRVVFSSAVKVTKQKASCYKYSLPGGDWAFTRKSAYHFGWDWGPRFVTCGIWQSVYLYQNKGISISNVAIVTKSIGQNEAEMNLYFDYSLPEDGKYRLELIDVDRKKLIVNKRMVFVKPNGGFVQHFVIQNPQLWWPNGMGEQHLYKFRLIIRKGRKVYMDKLCKIGVRTVELVNEPDSIGESFYFKVNGKPMFAKGANVIPPHSLLPSVSNSQWISIVEDAKKSNFNMVRVWGGGAYPPDVFMQACTEQGILVWQDFMFACSMYPWDDEYLLNVKVEVEQQIKRLKAHTSLAFWCGNNEIDEGWHNWGWKTQFNATPSIADSIWAGYQKLFHNILPSMVSQFDSTRSYWPSSPKFGWGHNESMTHGDSHYWGVWWGREPFDKYREKVPRFMSEYGFQGSPSIQTIKLFSNGGVIPDSTEMLCHQKHPVGYETIKTFLDRENFRPKTLADWIYFSQIVQSNGYQTAIESERFASPRCMGTLYWQLNDCWPVVSWSGIDYLGYWKAVQYTVQNCYRSILLASRVQDSVIVVNAVSDSLYSVSGKIMLTILSTRGDTLKSWTKEITLQPNTGIEVMKVSNPVSKINSNKYFLHTKFSLSSGQEFESVSFLGKLGELQVENPQIVQENTKVDDGGLLILSSKYPAFFVELSSENPNCRFEDNYLHIMPGKKYSIRYHGDLGDKLSLRWMNN